MDDMNDRLSTSAPPWQQRRRIAGPILSWGRSAFYPGDSEDQREDPVAPSKFEPPMWAALHSAEREPQYAH